MELFKESCKTCAGDLEPISASQYKCVCCGNVYTHDDVKKHVETLRSALDDMQLKAERNARRNLYKAVTDKYPSSKEVREWCKEIKKYLPDDFQANFYETANGDNAQLIAETIRGISDADIEKNAHDMETIIRFLISSMNKVYLADTQHLIERVYKRQGHTDLGKYEHYSTELSKEGENLEKGLYLTTRKRDVFIAYSSKDMALVLELLAYLEKERELTCFVALRNLKHGKGAKENYDKALQEAMSNCRSFVLVSSPNSRDFGCEALAKEIPYIQMLEGKGHKIHKVEYRVGRNTNTEADKDVRDFFESQEWALSKEEVGRRVQNAKTEEYLNASTEKLVEKPVEKVKYCVDCGNECSKNVKHCPECGCTDFANTLDEVELKRQLRKYEAELAAQKAKPANASNPGTSAPNPPMTSRPGGNGNYRVRLASAPEKKLDCIKICREVFGLGLKEAKDLVENSSRILASNLTWDDAAKIQDRFAKAAFDVLVEDMTTSAQYRPTPIARYQPPTSTAQSTTVNSRPTTVSLNNASTVSTLSSETKVEKTKYCVNCGEKCPQTVNFCSKCEGREFADTISEVNAVRKNKRLEAEMQALRASSASRVNSNVDNAYERQREAERREAMKLQTSKQNAEQMIASQVREKERLQELISDTTEKANKAVKVKPLRRWATFSVVMVVLSLAVLVIFSSMGSIMAIPVILVFLALDILVTLKFLKVYRKPQLLIILNMFTYGIFTLVLAAIAIHKCKNNKFPQYDQELRSLNDQLRNTEDRLNTARRSLDEINRKLGIY